MSTADLVVSLTPAPPEKSGPSFKGPPARSGCSHIPEKIYRRFQPL